MGKWNLVSFVLALGLAVGLACTLPPAQAGTIVNSKHDFSSSGMGGNWGSTDVNEVCVFCHTPHNAQTVSGGPLWNRAPLSKTFKTYANAGSGTLTATVGQPTGNTLLCLSCHDGSIAIDQFVRGAGAGKGMMAIGDVYYPGSPYGEGGPNIGGNYTGNPNVNDLSNDHPVSFTYDATLAANDGGLKEPGATGLPLFSSKLECATCHDVHNVKSVPGTKLLRVAIASSALCLSCHTK